MTDRVLSMLYQYLLSNQALELNNTFQIYCKILSVDHSAFNLTKKNPARKRRNVNNVHVGNSKRLYKYKWAIDVPSVEPPFTNLCLLIGTIFGLLQHCFFDSNERDKTFLYAQRINDQNQQKKKRAQSIINDKLEQLFSVNEPYYFNEYFIQFFFRHRYSFFFTLSMKRLCLIKL